MHKILITGASGLIGSNLIDILKNDIMIYSLTRRSGSTTSDSIKTIYCDLSKPIQIDELPLDIETIIHLAQSERFREFPDGVEDVFNVNTYTTLKLLDFARKTGVKRFIYASSGGIYGYSDEGFSEDQAIIAKKDLGFYLGSKLCSEVIVENYAPFMSVIVLRFFFVYGPKQTPHMLIPRLIQSVKEGRPITLQGQEGIRINPTYAMDAAQAILHALDINESQKINVGGPEVLTLRQVGEIIGRLVGKAPVFEVQENVKPRHIMGDITKMKTLLWEPKFSVEEGIKEILKS